MSVRAVHQQTGMTAAHSAAESGCVTALRVRRLTLTDPIETRLKSNFECYCRLGWSCSQPRSNDTLARAHVFAPCSDIQRLEWALALCLPLWVSLTVSPTESLSLGLPLGLPLWVSLTGSPTASLSLGLSHCVSLAASLAQALRRLGADLAKKDQLGRLPLHVAAGMGPFPLALV